MPTYKLKRDCGPHLGVFGGKERLLRPGNTIECEVHEMKGIRDKFDLISGTEDENAECETIPQSLVPVMRRADGLYDVMNEKTGRFINTVPMQMEKAYELAGMMLPEERERPVTARLKRIGGGWWNVLVDGIPVLKKNVRREEAERKLEELTNE